MFDKNDLSGIIGKHFVITYENGWIYELYAKNGQTIEYRKLIGKVGYPHVVKNQQADLVRLGKNIYKMSWTEPSGTNGCLTINMDEKILHCTVFYPQWIINRTEDTVCFHRDHISMLESYREVGPRYPIEVINEISYNLVVSDRGPDNDSAIFCASIEIPTDFPKNII